MKESYRKKMDSALNYMQGINISEEIQDRARKWFLYNWEQSKTIGESGVGSKKGGRERERERGRGRVSSTSQHPC